MFPVPRPTLNSGPTLNFFFRSEKKKNSPMRGAPIRAGFFFPMRLVFGDSFFSTKMAASYNWPSVVMAIKVNKCNHLEAKNFMLSVRNSKMIEEIFNDCHVVDDHEAYDKYHTIKCECRTELHSDEKFEVEQYLTVGEIVEKFNIKCIEFTCVPINKKSSLESAIADSMETATKRTVNAFQMLMAGGRAYPDFKTNK